MNLKKCMIVVLCLTMLFSVMGTGATEPKTTPSVDPSVSPSVDPSVSPSVDPSTTPSAEPTVSPTPALEAQKAPEQFVLKFSLNADGETFTATIPAVENGLYSFDGVTFSENNQKTDCLPDTSYTGYVKYAATQTALESPVTWNSKKTEKLKVKNPSISPESGEFKNSIVITITCDTKDAVIYYTTNGQQPSVASQRYTGSFDLTTTATVRAIAVKDGYDQSDVVTARYTKEKIIKRPARCNVYFETDGGTKIEERKIQRNTAVVRPADPKKEGYDFAGWYADASFTTEYDFEEKILKSVVIYAKWVPAKNQGTTEQADASKQIIMYIDQKEAIVFGKKVVNDVAPLKIKDCVTMLPARFVAEHLGADVDWDEDAQTVTVTKGEILIVIRIGEHYAEVNDQPVKLQYSTAFTQNNRAYVPLRFLCESLGADVDWEEETQKIIITK